MLCCCTRDDCNLLGILYRVPGEVEEVFTLTICEIPLSKGLVSGYQMDLMSIAYGKCTASFERPLFGCLGADSVRV